MTNRLIWPDVGSTSVLADILAVPPKSMGDAIAVRPIFVPTEADSLVVERTVEFEWFPGFAVSQKRRSIESLHAAAESQGLAPLLEISSKSTVGAGVALSAFHLPVHTDVGTVSVENAFQASKVYERGGPFLDLLTTRPIDAKRDARHKSSGALTGFRFGGQDWPLSTGTLFYDYLYLKALRSSEWDSDVLRYTGFTDIEFNPKKSLNCQARSCALFVALARRGELDDCLEDRRVLWSTTRRYIANALSLNPSRSTFGEQLQL